MPVIHVELFKLNERTTTMTRRRSRMEMREQTTSYGIKKGLSQLEINTVYEMVIKDNPWTGWGFIQALWDREYITFLRKAFTELSVYTYGEVQLPVGSKYIKIKLSEFKLATPDQINVPFELRPQLMLIGDKLREVTEPFTELQDLVDWFDRRRNLAAIRYYFPALASVAPAKHEIHAAYGKRIREIPDINEVADKIRRGASTIAAALMCPAAHPVSTPVSLSVRDIGVFFCGAGDAPSYLA